MQSDNKFTISQVFYQIVSDWFGKDAQTDYTYSYVWMANQFGHFGLGFILSIFIFWILILLNVPANMFIYVLAGQGVFWIFKEVRDYFVIIKETYTCFVPDKLFIIKDLSTDVFFILYGSVVAYIGLGISGLYGLLSFAAGLIPTLFLFVYWIKRKMYFQITAIPYYYRLSNFFGTLPKEQVDGINRFVKKRKIDLPTDWQHILIFGPYNSGKTSLAIGIGTDFAVNLGYSRYMSFNKFLDLLNLETEKVYEEGTKIVPWRKTELLIVDNVSVGIDKQTAFNPELLRDAILNSKYKGQNITTLQNQKTIWVIGNPTMANEWNLLFSHLQLNKSGTIATIQLSDQAPVVKVFKL